MEDKQFNLDGVNITLPKEKLQEMLKEYDTRGEVKKDGYDGIRLYKNGKETSGLLYNDGEVVGCNLSTISRVMAHAMDDLMKTKDALDSAKVGHHVHCDGVDKNGCVGATYCSTNGKHFKTRKTAQLAAKLLNESKDLKALLMEGCK